MAKLTLTDITNSNLVTAYNANNDAIIAAFEKCLFRDGTSPNQMTADLDMNSNAILNAGGLGMGGNTITDVGTGVNGTDAVNVTQLITYASLDFSAISSEMDYGELATSDWFAVWDTSAGLIKKIEHKKAHIPVTTVADTTDTLADEDTNTFIKYTSASAVTVTLPTGVGGIGTSISIGQWGAGQVTVSASGTTLRAPNGAKTALQYSVIQLFCVAADEWVVMGDATT